MDMKRVMRVTEGVIRDIPIRAGEVSLLPAHVRHSPQRPVPDSVGLVVENERRPGDLDGFEWFCFGCGTLLHRVEISVTDIVKDLPPLFAAFYANVSATEISTRWRSVPQPKQNHSKPSRSPGRRSFSTTRPTESGTGAEVNGEHAPGARTPRLRGSEYLG